MAKIDLNWIKTDVGSHVLQSIHSNGKLKSFGVLEKPTLAAPYLHYEEVNYKVLLVGKGSCGKTSFIETICSPKTYISSLRSDADDINDSGNHFYPETPGIQITHVYWPVKMANFEKFLMFDLAMWDVGKQAITKYDYIIPSSTDNLDCFLFVFSWTDKQSFMEIYESIKNYANSNEQHLPKLIIGTKFDQIIHSEIDQELVEELESIAQTKVIRFSSLNCSFENISFIMNKLCEVLLLRDQQLAIN